MLMSHLEVEWAKLKKLLLSGTNQFTNEGLKVLRSLKDLEELSLCGDNLFSDELVSVKSAKSARRLIFSITIYCLLFVLHI